MQSTEGGLGLGLELELGLGLGLGLGLVTLGGLPLVPTILFIHRHFGLFPQIYPTLHCIY